MLNLFSLLTPPLNELAQCRLSANITREDDERHAAMTRCLFITSPKGHTRSCLANNKCAFSIQALGSGV